MAKLPHQSAVTPVDDQDVATKEFAESSGGGAGPAAQGDYLVVGLGSDQIPLVVGDYAEFDVAGSVFEQRGTGINPNGNPGEIVLTAGRTYVGRFTFYTPFAAGGQSVRMQWVDAATDVALPGASSAQARDTGSGGDISSSDSVVFIHAPLVDTVVACRVFAIEETPGLGSSSVIDIFEIGASSFEGGGGDYLQVRLAVIMTSVSLPQRVLFDTIDTNRGALVLDVTTNVGRISGLKAGRTYLMQTALAAEGSGHFTRFQWYDVTAAALLPGVAFAISTNSGGVRNSTSIATHVFTPSVDTEVEVRITSVDDVTDDIREDETWATVIEIGGPPPSGVGEGELIEVAATVDQDNITDGTTVIFSRTDAARGDLALNSNQITGFKAGRTYLLIGAINFGTTGRMTLKFRDATGAADIGSPWDVRTPDLNSAATGGSVGISVFVPLVDSVVEIQRVSGSATTLDIKGDDGSNSAWTTFKVYELGGPPSPSIEALQSNLWFPPQVPNALDIEFVSTTIDPSWAWSTTPDGAAVDPYASHSSGGPRIAVHSDLRRSWLKVQAPANNVSHYLHRAVSIPTNFLFWARLSFNSRGQISPVNNDMSIGITISATDTGIPSGADRVVMYLNEADGGVNQANAQLFEGGSILLNTVTTNLYGSTMQGQPLEYVALHKVGTTFHFWVATANGSWIHMGSRVYAGAALDRVGIIFQNNSTASPGTPILGCDFLRFVESATFLP